MYPDCKISKTIVRSFAFTSSGVSYHVLEDSLVFLATDIMLDHVMSTATAAYFLVIDPIALSILRAIIVVEGELIRAAVLQLVWYHRQSCSSVYFKFSVQKIDHEGRPGRSLRHEGNVSTHRFFRPERTSYYRHYRTAAQSQCRRHMDLFLQSRLPSSWLCPRGTVVQERSSHLHPRHMPELWWLSWIALCTVVCLKADWL